MLLTIAGWSVASLISITLWPIVLLLSLVNEIWRLVISFRLPKNFQLTSNCFGNFLWSDMFNSRMVIAALYSEQTADISKDIERFEQIFMQNPKKKSSHDYSDLKKTQVGKLGFGCLRDDTDTFKVTNHVKIFNSILPQNGEYFTEKEFSKVILPQYLSTNMDESKPRWEWLVFPTIRRDNGSFQSLRVFRWDHRYMDGACAGTFMAECVFDEWKDDKKNSQATLTEPPYIYNPKSHPPYRAWLFVAKLWAVFHLPLILLMSLFDLWGNQGNSTRPFAVWKNKERKVFSKIHSLNVSDIKIFEKESKTKSYTFKSLLLTRLIPVLSRLWGKLNPSYKYDESVNVATFQALLPYHKGTISNQFTILEAKVPLNLNEENTPHDFPIDMTFFFANVYTEWISRLPIWFIQKLAAPAEATVALNSVPYLKKMGSICGSQIIEIASWDILYTPVGVDFTVMGYGGKIFISAFSVEECMSFDEINELLNNYVKALTEG